MHVEPSRAILRMGMLLLAVVLFGEFAWILPAQYTRSLSRPTGPRSSSAPSAPMIPTCVAAGLAVVRGELWAECARDRAEPLFGTASVGALEAADIQAARDAAER